MLKYLALNKLLLALAAFLFPLGVQGQQAADTVSAGNPATEEASFSYKPEAARIGIDVSRLVGNMVDPEREYYELNGDLSFGRYILSADWGTGRQYRYDDNLDYRTSGSYFRVGPDINFIADSEDRNAFFVGLRFGWSGFEEKLTTTYAVPGWESFPVNPERQTSAHWFEGVGGLKARVWKSFYLGYTLRLKFGLRVHDDNFFTAYEVPGFGRVGDGSTFSFNYHVFYRIPFRKD